MMDDLLQEMIDPAPPVADRPRRRRMWTTVGIVGLAVVGATSLTTSALFSDTDSSSAEISTGTVDLAVGATSFTLEPGGMAPGDTAYSPVAVDNAGSLELRYAVEYRAETLATGPSPAPTLADPVTPRSLGTVVQLAIFRTDTCTAQGVAGLTPLGSADGAVTPLSETFVPLVGNPGTGPDEGDRALGAGTAEALCVRVHLPIGADNSYQDTALALALRMQAEQVANNDGTTAS